MVVIAQASGFLGQTFTQHFLHIKHDACVAFAEIHSVEIVLHVIFAFEDPAFPDSDWTATYNMLIVHFQFPFLFEIGPDPLILWRSAHPGLRSEHPSIY